MKRKFLCYKHMSGERTNPPIPTNVIVLAERRRAPKDFTERVMQEIKKLPVYIGGPTPPDDNGGKAG